jgi:hypothetical protein
MVCYILLAHGAVNWKNALFQAIENNGENQFHGRIPRGFHNAAENFPAFAPKRFRMTDICRAMGLAS